METAAQNSCGVAVGDVAGGGGGGGSNNNNNNGVVKTKAGVAGREQNPLDDAVGKLLQGRCW